MGKVDLPDKPDIVALNQWLTDAYTAWWAKTPGGIDVREDCASAYGRP